MKPTFCGRLVTVLMVSLLLQPWGAYRLMAADITPGYTFASGEANVTHTKLNNSASGTIATTFYSGKSAAGASMTPGNYTLLGLDSVSGLYRRATLDQWVFNHSALIGDRAVITAPNLAHTILIYDAGAYKQITETNLFYGGTASGAPTNETLLPALRGGDFGSLTYSNMIGGLLGSHAVPTNGDVIVVLTENGRAVKQLSLQTLFSAGTAGTNFNKDHILVSWDGTRLRWNRATNLVDGLPVAAPTTNDQFSFMQGSTLNKTNLAALALLLGKVNIVQSTYTGTTNFTFTGASGTWSNVTTISSSTLSNAITPRATSSKILVRVVLSASSSGSGDNGYMRVLRNGAAIGVGDDDSGGSRVKAGAAIINIADPGVAVFEWLDSPASTSAVGYNVQVSGVSGNTVYINRDANDANNTSNGRYVSTLTLTEILQ